MKENINRQFHFYIWRKISRKIRYTKDRKLLIKYANFLLTLSYVLQENSKKSNTLTLKYCF